MSRCGDVSQIWFARKVMTRSAAHDNKRATDKRGLDPRLSVAKERRLEREPQFRTNRSTIINSFLRETEIVATETIVEIHVRDHRLT